jgi:hypothetical protein
MKPILKDGKLIIKDGGFHGGRNNRKGDGFVEIEFSRCVDAEIDVIVISIMDNLTSIDGHYSPVWLDLKSAETLRYWLDEEINKLKNKAEDLNDD